MPRSNSLVLENVLCNRQFNFAFSALFSGKHQLTFIYSRGQVKKVISFLNLHSVLYFQARIN